MVMVDLRKQWPEYFWNLYLNAKTDNKESLPYYASKVDFEEFIYYVVSID